MVVDHGICPFFRDDECRAAEEWENRRCIFRFVDLMRRGWPTCPRIFPQVPITAYLRGDGE